LDLLFTFVHLPLPRSACRSFRRFATFCVYVLRSTAHLRLRISLPQLPFCTVYYLYYRYVLDFHWTPAPLWILVHHVLHLWIVSTVLRLPPFYRFAVLRLRSTAVLLPGYHLVSSDSAVHVHRFSPHVLRTTTTAVVFVHTVFCHRSVFLDPFVFVFAPLFYHRTFGFYRFTLDYLDFRSLQYRSTVDFYTFTFAFGRSFLFVALPPSTFVFDFPFCRSFTTVHRSFTFTVSLRFTFRSVVYHHTYTFRFVLPFLRSFVRFVRSLISIFIPRFVPHCIFVLVLGSTSFGYTLPFYTAFGSTTHLWFTFTPFSPHLVPLHSPPPAPAPHGSSLTWFAFPFYTHYVSHCVYRILPVHGLYDFVHISRLFVRFVSGYVSFVPLFVCYRSCTWFCTGWVLRFVSSLGLPGSVFVHVHGFTHTAHYVLGLGSFVPRFGLHTPRFPHCTTGSHLLLTVWVFTFLSDLILHSVVHVSHYSSATTTPGLPVPRSTTFTVHVRYVGFGFVLSTFVWISLFLHHCSAFSWLPLFFTFSFTLHYSFLPHFGFLPHDHVPPAFFLVYTPALHMHVLVPSHTFSALASILLYYCTVWVRFAVTPAATAHHGSWMHTFWFTWIPGFLYATFYS